MTTPMRTVYAQSSDIRSRSWLEYRRDMKKKAIAELEFLPFLEKILKGKHGDDVLRVRKYGGDAQLWFHASGRGVTGSPDYLATWGDGESRLYEFQLAEDITKLQFFDFKVSKVGKKQGGRASRTPIAISFISLRTPRNTLSLTRNGLLKTGRFVVSRLGAIGQPIGFLARFSCLY